MHAMGAEFRQQCLQSSIQQTLSSVHVHATAVSPSPGLTTPQAQLQAGELHAVSPVPARNKAPTLALLTGDVRHRSQAVV